MKLVLISLVPFLSSCPTGTAPPPAGSAKPASSQDRFLDKLEQEFLDIAADCRGGSASCFWDKGHDHIEFTACKPGTLPATGFSSVKECDSEALKLLQYVAEQGNSGNYTSYRRRRRSSRGRGGGGGDDSSPSGACGGEAAPVKTEILNSACPSSGSAAINTLRQSDTARFGQAHRFLHEDFRQGAVGESNSDQDLILVFYMYEGNIALGLNETRLSAAAGDNFYVYVGGKRQTLSILGGSFTGGERYGDDEVVPARISSVSGSVRTALLSGSAQTIHLAEQKSGECEWWQSSGKSVAAGACPSTPPADKKLTDMTFSEWGRYHKSGYSMDPPQGTLNHLLFGQDNPVLLYWFRPRHDKKFVVFNGNRVSFSDSKTYYMYIKIGNGAKNRYSLSKAEEEYCGDNDIPHISFEVEGGPNIPANSSVDFWLAEEEGATCLFYKGI